MSFRRPSERSDHRARIQGVIPRLRLLTGGEPVLADERFLRRAYAAHSGELYGYARRALDDDGLAEEAVQETFMRAWRSAERFDENLGSLRGWLFAICRNIIIDVARTRSVRFPVAVSGTEPVENGDAMIDTALQGWLVEEALGRLTKDHRNALVESYFEGRSAVEIGVRHGVPEGTIRSRLFYGLKALRLTLDEMGWHDNL